MPCAFFFFTCACNPSTREAEAGRSLWLPHAHAHAHTHAAGTHHLTCYRQAQWGPGGEIYSCLRRQSSIGS